MKQINQLLNKADPKGSLNDLTKSENETSRQTALPIHWITELFKVFQARFLHRWTSAIDGIEERAVEEWSKELAGITGEQLKFGLENWNSQWPPNSGEFKQCCLGVLDTTGWEHNTQAYRMPVIPESRRIGAVRASEAVVRAELAAIKSKLGMKNDT